RSLPWHDGSIPWKWAKPSARLQKTNPLTLQKSLYFRDRRQRPLYFYAPIAERPLDPAIHNSPMRDAPIPWSARGGRKIQKFPAGSSCSQSRRLYARGVPHPPAARTQPLPESRRRESIPLREVSRPRKLLASTHSDKGSPRSAPRRETPCRHIHFP